MTSRSLTGIITQSKQSHHSGMRAVYYYGGSRYDHGWSINTDFSLKEEVAIEEHRGSCRVMLAKIKRDRFASLAATYRGSFDVDAAQRSGDQLCLNARCPNGSIRVAIAEQSNPLHGALRKSDWLPGYSFDDCIPFSGDAIASPVRYRNASVADLPRDLYLCLRFEICRGEIFGYEWKS